MSSYTCARIIEFRNRPTNIRLISQYKSGTNVKFLYLTLAAGAGISGHGYVAIGAPTSSKIFCFLLSEY